MGSLIVNEKRMNDNIFLYEDRLSNPTTRFQEDTPTYVTYYHIDSDNTTNDAGFEDIASVLGSRSPMRFHKTSEFPIYMSNEILPSLQDMDQGLDVEIEGEAVILPNTIKPLPHDFFVIPYLHSPFIFEVTGIEYDNVKPGNYYKINFTLHSIDEDDIIHLEKQTTKSYTCVIDNIGTENICVIEDQIYKQIEEIEKIYDDMVSTYISIFYNKRYNCFLGVQENGRFLYDPHQAEFINRYNLFNKQRNLSTIYLTKHWNDKKARIKYEKTLYKALERRRLDMVTCFPYSVVDSRYIPESGFSAYNDLHVDVLDIVDLAYKPQYKIFSDEFVKSIEVNGPLDNNYAILIQRFLRNEDLNINDIPLDLMDELLRLDANLEMFFFVPVVLYIIRNIINKEMKS